MEITIDLVLVGDQSLGGQQATGRIDVLATRGAYGGGDLFFVELILEPGQDLFVCAFQRTARDFVKAKMTTPRHAVHKTGWIRKGPVSYEHRPDISNCH